MTTFHLNDTWPYPFIMQFSPPGPGFITGNLVNRYSQTQLQSGMLLTRYSDAFSSGNLFLRYGDAEFLTDNFVTRYRDLSAAFVAAIGTQLPLPSTSFGIPAPTIAPSGLPVGPAGSFFPFGITVYVEQASTGTILLLADSTTNVVESFTFTTKKNSGSSFSMKLAYDFGSLTQSEITNIETLLSEQNMAGDQNIDIKIFVEVQVADQIVTLPPLVVLQKQYQEDENGWTWTLQGMDWLTRMLNKRNLNSDSYSSGPESIGGDGPIWMASDVLIDFLGQFGITALVLNFDDYPIRTVHIQNTRPIDILNQILFVPRAFWWSQGMTLMTQPWQVGQNPNWVYQDQPNLVTTFIEETQSIELINAVKVNLSIPAGVKGTTLEETTWGRFMVNLTPPLRTPLVQWEIAQNGVAQDIDYFDVNGNWVAHFPQESNKMIPPQVGNGGFIGNTAMIGSVAVVWAPPLNLGVTASDGNNYATSLPTTHFKVIFRGADPLGPIFDNFIPPNTGPYSVPAEVTAFSNVFVNGVATTQTPTGGIGVNAGQQYSIIVENTASVAQYGYLEAEHPVENAFIPNLAWAWRVGVNVLQESGRLKSTYRVKVPMNPVMNVGDTVQVIDSSKFINLTGLVEEITHTVDSEMATTEFYLTVYTA